MSDIVGSIWWMVVALGVLVTFHEFGHYWVARRCGVKVLRFSVGFGKPLWSRRNRNGTEFAIAAIPLGGYVKMLDEAEGDVASSELSQAFNRKPVLQRIAIVAAGPIANLVLCVALLWAMFVLGRQDYSATVGHAQEMAAEGGFQAGDRLLAVDDDLVSAWGAALQAMTLAAMDGRDVRVEVTDALGNRRNRTLALSTLPSGFDQENVAGIVGFAWRHQMAPAVVEQTSPGSPASRILKPGDQVTALDGDAVRSFSDTPHWCRSWRKRRRRHDRVERDGERLALDTRPSGPVIRIGAGILDPGHRPTSQAAPAPTMPSSSSDHSPPYRPPSGNSQADSSSLGMIRRMFTGHASVKNISGPLTIARSPTPLPSAGPTGSCTSSPCSPSAWPSSTCFPSRSWTAGTCCITL